MSIKFLLRHIALAFLSVCLVSCGQKLDTWKTRKVEQINKELSDESHPFRKQVQERHLTVTVKDAKITRMEVQTKHDFAWSGRDDSNIVSFEFDVTLTWDGLIHKNGTTVLRINMSPLDNKIISAKIAQTDAAINIGDSEIWKCASNEIKSLFQTKD